MSASTRPCDRTKHAVTCGVIAQLAFAALVTACSGPTRLPPANTLAHAPTAPPVPQRLPVGARVAWSEHFTGALDWVDPFGHDPASIARNYTVSVEGSDAFLRARHDVGGVSSPTPPIHLGKAFPSDPPPLASVRLLRWRWRVLEHPRVTAAEPWADVAASLYVVVQQPSIFVNGTGFKFGWLATAAPDNTFQRGLAQIPLRVGGATNEWVSEEVDLCALYRERFGPCEGEFLRYVGVMTDADGTRSHAAADYADFELLVTAP